ncbi:uncharacterized protein [Asterias amurensis]|uniref:uncharacterized protein n=1 Tax=Asterias amurensis TaxID=7602 RepID=UPI003AB38B99
MTSGTSERHSTVIKANEYFECVVSEFLRSSSNQNASEKARLVKECLWEMNVIYMRKLDTTERTDWSDECNRCAYVYRFFAIHSYMVYESLQLALANEEHLTEKWKDKSSFRVCCIGGGPGSDALGLTKFLRDTGLVSTNRLKCTIFDRYQEWEDTWHKIKQSNASDEFPLMTYFSCDMTRSYNGLSMNELDKNIRSADIVSFVKFVSTVADRIGSNSDCGNLLREVFRELQPGALVLYIDNRKSDRDEDFKKIAAFGEVTETPYKSNHDFSMPVGNRSDILTTFDRVTGKNPYNVFKVSVMLLRKPSEEKTLSRSTCTSPIFHTEADNAPEAEPNHTEADNALPEARPIHTEADNALPEAEPTHTKADNALPEAEPIHTEADNALPEARPIHTEADEALPEAEPIHTEADNALPEAEPIHTEADNALPEAEPIIHTEADKALPEAEPMYTEADEALLEAEPIHPDADNALPEARPIHTEADNALPEAEPTHTKADNALPEAEPIHTEADNALPEARPIHTEADEALPEAEPIHTEADNALPEAEPIHTEADNALPEAEPMHTEADNALPEAEPTHTEADNALPEAEPIHTEADNALPEARPIHTEADEALPEAEPIHTEADNALPEAEPIHTEADNALPEVEPIHTESDVQPQDTGQVSMPLKLRSKVNPSARFTPY